MTYSRDYNEALSHISRIDDYRRALLQYLHGADKDKAPNLAALSIIADSMTELKKALDLLGVEPYK